MDEKYTVEIDVDASSGVTIINTFENTVKSADKAVEKLKKTNETLANSANELQQKYSNVDRTMRDTAASVLSLEAKYNPLAAAVRRTSADMEKAEAAMKRGGAEGERAAAVLEVIRQRHERLAEAYSLSQRGLISQTEAMSRMSAIVHGQASGVRSMAAAHDVATQSTSRFTGMIGQAGFQLQDFAVQVAGGQSVLLALTQQGSQLAGAFGPMGAAIGAVGAIAGTAAMVFLGLGDNTTDAEKATKAYDDVLNSVRGTIDLASEAGKRLRAGHEQEVLSVADLTTHYRTLSETMLQVERIRLTAEKNKALEGLAAQRTAVSELLGDLDGLDIAADRVLAFQSAVNRSRSALGAPLLADMPAEIRNLSTALKDFKASAPGDVEAIGRLAVALDSASKAGGPFAEEAKKAAEALVAPAQQSVNLSTQLTRLEDGLTAVGAAAMHIPVPGRKPGESGASSFATAAGDAKTLTDILADLNAQAQQMDQKKVTDAWSLLNRTWEEGLTPAEKYRRKVDQVQDAIQLVQAHVEGMGLGLQALSPEQIERINEALRQQSPEWEEAKRQQASYAEQMRRAAEDIDDIPESAPISGEALAVIEEAFQ